MKRVFIAGLDTETNTFSPLLTTRDSFAACLLAHGDATARPLNHCSAQLFEWRTQAEARGWSVIESLCAVAEPGGVTQQSAYEAFREEILTDLRAAGKVALVLLALHGAMVAEEYDDVEGDLLEKIRRQVGSDTCIGVELDPHCHLTETMVRNATIIVLYKENPHTDIVERARELFDRAVDTLEGRIRPVMAVFDCHMLGSFRTQDTALRSFVERMQSLEGHRKIVSVSFAHGFPWGDVPDVGSKILVVADQSLRTAQRLAERLGRHLYTRRSQFASRFTSIEDAFSLLEATDRGPTVLADVADNPGGGAGGDATFLLSRALQSPVRPFASALHWEPEAVAECKRAGGGATVDLCIGGRFGATSGQSLQLRGKVVHLRLGCTQRFGAFELPFGDAVWFRSEGVDIILNDGRTQVFHPDCFTKLGLNLSEYRAITVKSANHFYASFHRMAHQILFVDSPGALQRKFDRIRYTKLSRQLWPIVSDPCREVPAGI